LQDIISQVLSWSELNWTFGNSVSGDMLKLLNQKGIEQLERWDFFKNFLQISIGGNITAS